MRGSTAGGSRIDQLVLVDRVVDLISPMCTQLTYEGLIDETLHIKNGTVTTETSGGGRSRSGRQSGLPLLMLPSCDAARQAGLSPKCCCNVLLPAPAEMHTLLMGRLLAICCISPITHPVEELTQVMTVGGQCWFPCLESSLCTCPAAPAVGLAQLPNARFDALISHQLLSQQRQGSGPSACP